MSQAGFDVIAHGVTQNEFGEYTSTNVRSKVDCVRSRIRRRLMAFDMNGGFGDSPTSEQKSASWPNWTRIRLGPPNRRFANGMIVRGPIQGGRHPVYENWRKASQASNPQ